MEKRVIKQEAYYKIIWSPIEKYDRHLLTRLMPEMPGITGLFYKDDSGYAPVLFLECWRDGVRDGIKNFMDPIFIRYKEIRENIDMDEVYVSYTIIAAPKDLQDILHCLIQTHRPPNNSLSFPNSSRYKKIYVAEAWGKNFDGIGKR